MNRKHYIIFTDLDGSLLDLHSYSWREAENALKLIRAKNIPLVFCSSKTCSEQQYYRQALNIRDPFIIENGGAVLIPQGYFTVEYKKTRSIDGFDILELGLPAPEIAQRLKAIRSRSGMAFSGYGDMCTEDVARITGLDLDAARRAMQRNYSETLVDIGGSQQAADRLDEALRAEGLQMVSGGRFHSVMGGNDKGTAVRILSGLYSAEKNGSIISIGIGDSSNDEPLLNAVDIPVLVQKPDRTWEDSAVRNLCRVPHVGPRGWNAAILDFFGTEPMPAFAE